MKLFSWCTILSIDVKLNSKSILKMCRSHSALISLHFIIFLNFGIVIGSSCEPSFQVCCFFSRLPSLDLGLFLFFIHLYLLILFKPRDIFQGEPPYSVCLYSFIPKKPQIMILSCCRTSLKGNECLIGFKAPWPKRV